MRSSDLFMKPLVSLVGIHIHYLHMMLILLGRRCIRVCETDPMLMISAHHSGVHPAQINYTTPPPTQLNRH